MVSIPVVGVLDLSKRHEGTIDLGNGWRLQDIPTTGEGSILWLDLGDGCAAVDYEAMERRDAALS